MMDDEASVVIDNGTGLMKAGFAGDDAPRAVFPTTVGHKHREDRTEDMLHESCYVGDDAHTRRASLAMKYPVNVGIIMNWDDMERLWQHAFYQELQVAPEECPVLMTEPPLNPKMNREKTTQIMFETFRVPGFYLAIQAVLALYASGRTTGIVLDCGHGVAHSVPVYEGYSLPHAIHHFDFVGHDITMHLKKLLSERGYALDSVDPSVLRDMKEKLAYVAEDYHEEMRIARETPSVVERSYTLPDGQVITLGSERFCCAEPLFQVPGARGLDELTHSSIRHCELDIRFDLYKNIILAGGTTMLPGFGERVRKHITDQISSTTVVKVHTPPERKYSAWIGGSILASLSTFLPMWINRQDYEEHGPPFVHRRCF